LLVVQVAADQVVLVPVTLVAQVVDQLVKQAVVHMTENHNTQVLAEHNRLLVHQLVPDPGHQLFQEASPVTQVMAVVVAVDTGAVQEAVTRNQIQWQAVVVGLGIYGPVW
jgi:hypothetical protein